MSLRCVYTDLDGTLLGAGASLFRDGDGEFTLLPARALEACHRAGVEVVCMSGRRKAQVAEGARLMGQSAYIYEVGSGVVIDGEEHFLCGGFAPQGEANPHQLIGATGAPALLERELDIEPHAPWHVGRFVSHLYRGVTDADRANELLASEGHTGLRLVDNGEAAEGGHTFHLIPAEASKVAAVALHMRARGYAPADCIAVGDSVEDMTVAAAVGRFFLVANSDAPVTATNVERTESGFGEGFYEAVVQSLVG